GPPSISHMLNFPPVCYRCYAFGAIFEVNRP
ncbi:unnamed protein product, partial [Allacma fusca]